MRGKDKVMALDAGAQAALEPDMQAYFAKCKEKLGFVPNVLRAYAFDNAKLRAFILMADDLMLGDSGLSKLEREMIAVAVSSVNHCHYCLTAHGAAVRQRGRDPELGELIAQNYRAADLDAAPEGDARFRGQAHGSARQDRGAGPRGAARGPGSAIATSGTSPPSPPSTTCRTGSRRRPTCDPTGSTTTWCGSRSKPRLPSLPKRVARGLPPPPRNQRRNAAAGGRGRPILARSRGSPLKAAPGVCHICPAHEVTINRMHRVGGARTDVWGPCATQ